MVMWVKESDGVLPAYVQEAQDLASSLGITHHVLDVREDFQQCIIGNFTTEYMAGRTPNPCVQCNMHIKMKYLLSEADRLGCDYIATGHYAQRLDVPGEGSYILRGADVNKDQFFGYDFAMNDYLSNLSIAFHWKPNDPTKTQRTFWINGKISLEMAGTEPSVMTLTDLGFKSLMMNEEVDAYKKNAGNGSIRFDNAVNAGEICYQGCSGNVLSYAIDGWVFTSPRPLNKVANDKGIVVKNLQNYIHEYVYTWDKPGTYEVVFVGRNENYAASSEQFHKYTITILEKPSAE